MSISQDNLQTMPHIFPPVGQCIYCGTSAGALQDEHIIAYSLNGTAVLPKASCPKCGAITSNVERIFARGPAWPMRAALGFQSYKGRKKYPNSFPLLMDIAGQRQTVSVPLSEFPIILQLPIFSALPSFTNDQRNVPITSDKTVLVSLRAGTSPTELLQQIGRKYHADGIEVPRVDHKAFARLIAKSAYAMAVAQFGIATIKEKYVVPGVLGKADDLGTWVGSSPSPLQGELGEHVTQVQSYKTPASENVIVVLMKLFGPLPTPGYVAIPASKA